MTDQPTSDEQPRHALSQLLADRPDLASLPAVRVSQQELEVASA